MKKETISNNHRAMRDNEKPCDNCAYNKQCTRRSDKVIVCEFRGEWI